MLKSPWRQKSRLVRYWKAVWRPSARLSLGTLVIGGIAAGIALWGGFNWALELTNTESFCISCHEMEVNVYEEYRRSVHDRNRTGVRATCPDCHVPKEWVHKVVRKIRASNELYHKVVGTIDTPDKFEARRMRLAEHVWKSMKATDSRECRNCHTLQSMALDEQTGRARRKHEVAAEKGDTCIDCHKGIAHELPEEFEEEE